MTGGAGRTVTYNVANKPAEINSEAPSPAGVIDFAYDANDNRVLQVATDASGTSRTVYVGLGGTGQSTCERTTKGTTSTYTFFIYAGSTHGGSALAVRMFDQFGSVTANNYFNFDHLGSTTAVSNDKGHVASVASAGAAAGVLGYDPWGSRRNPDGQAADPTTFKAAPGNREFTGQETISSIELVNMNGRIYDPIVGRFLSPDPNVQSQTDLQSYNRYSYVLNNPLRYTDPTGYFSIGSVGSWLSANGPGIFIGLVGIAACASAGPAGCALVGVATSLLTASVAKAEGASWGQVGVSVLIGIMAGSLGGAAGSAIVGPQSSAAVSFAGAVVGGAVGGAAGGVLQSLLPGGGGLGKNVLYGAVQGAVWGAVGWGYNKGAALTQADVQGTESQAIVVERTETVEAGSSPPDDSDDAGMTVSAKDGPSRNQRNRYIIKSLDALADPSGENAEYFYSQGKSMHNTDPVYFEGRHADWVGPGGDGQKIPAGAVRLGEGQTHPTNDFGDEARHPLGSIADDMRLAVQFKSNSWVRLTTGEIIVIDPNAGMVSQIRPPLNGAPVAFPNPVQIPSDILRYTPQPKPMRPISL
jgi:RHS repeat-associated protein